MFILPQQPIEDEQPEDNIDDQGQEKEKEEPTWEAEEMKTQQAEWKHLTLLPEHTYRQTNLN